MLVLIQLILTDGPKQILSGTPDKLERKPELCLLSRGGERELPQAVVDAQVHLEQALITITLFTDQSKVGVAKGRQRR